MTAMQAPQGLDEVFRFKAFKARYKTTQFNAFKAMKRTILFEGILKRSIQAYINYSVIKKY